MPQMNFIKIDQVEGESKFRGHENEIEVLSWNWAIGNVSAGTSSAGGGAATKPVVSDIIFTHYVDMASPKLMRLCLTGARTRRAVLSVRSAVNATVDYFKLTFDEVMIVSVVLSASENCQRTVETVTMKFTKVTEEYIKVSATGAAGARLSTSFDLSTSQVV